MTVPLSVSLPVAGLARRRSATELDVLLAEQAGLLHEVAQALRGQLDAAC